MKCYLRTWRYSQDTTNLYHGRTIAYEPGSMTLFIYDPVLEEKEEYSKGISTVVTILSGDELTIASCRTGCACGE